jgi:hypothetical protein
MFGHPALWLLVRLKIGGAVRAQIRRLKKPRNWIFLVLGIGLFSLWFGSVLFSGVFRQSIERTHEELILFSEIALLVMTTLTVTGAFNHRGLYLPKEEIELCFTAPVSRSDLIRYRLLTNLLRSLFAGVFFGLAVSQRLPNAGLAFAGTFVTMLTVPILGQALALLLGDAENRWAAFAKKLPLRGFSIVLGALTGIGVALFFFGSMPLPENLIGPGGFLSMSGSTPLASPWVHALLAPFRPWASMIAARDALEFLPWFVLCVAIWFAAFELTARIPVDFRELSLATSADIAKRINRIRRGGLGAASAASSKPSLSWRAPWLFGRGPFGAVAWLKLVSIVRKARGTLVFALIVVAFVSILFSSLISRGDFGTSREGLLLAAGLTAGMGTLYLCTGLRFDFRQDLERMDLIKTWPLHPALLFLANLLPEIVLVYGVLALAILVRCAIVQAFDPWIVAILAFQPLVTLAWVALDNAVYLYSPVRYTPGQEGALQHMGRSLLLTLLRMGLFSAALVIAGLPAGLVVLGLTKLGGFDLEPALGIGALVAWMFLAALDGVLVVLGGMVLRRFDVARDKG